MIDADIRFTTGDIKTIKDTSYRTISNSSGDFLIEIPAGSYNIYGMYTLNHYGTEIWCGSGTAIVTRGGTVDMGELKLSWQQAYLDPWF